MKRTEFFTARTPQELQLSVNSWLAEHKDVGLIDSGMALGLEEATPVYSFYLLYEVVEATTATAISEQVANVLPEGTLTEPSDTQLQ
jgi:hypothetical protein